MHLPAGMRARHRGAKTYYYLDSGDRPRKETPLGSDYVLAVQRWAELTASERPIGAVVTFKIAADRYVAEVLPSKAQRTQLDNLAELQKLLSIFNDPPMALNDIEPVHIRKYLDWRVETAVALARSKNADRAKAGRPVIEVTGKEGAIRANREKALFSHIWNFARSVGLTNKANPCAGVKGFKEDGRDVYVTDQVCDAVHDVAEQPLRDALDLAYLTAQRPADVLKISKRDIKGGELEVEQGKTGKRLRIAIIGEFARVIARCVARSPMSMKLVNNRHGLPLTRHELRGAFDRARVAAAAKYPDLADEIAQYQFRDLRAKAGTDKDESHGAGAAKDQLGHTTEHMTAHYIRHRRGKLVTPTK